MKVALHTVAATKQGASTDVIAGTLRGLLRAAPEHEYVLFLNSELDIELPRGVSRVEASIGGPMSRTLWDQVSYPKLLRRIGADISVGCFGFAAIRPPIPQVVILQNALYFCDTPKNSPYASARSLTLERWLLKRIVRSANAVVVPSKTMADGVRKWLRSGDAVHVITDAWEGDVAEISIHEWAEPWKLIYIAHLERHKAHLELVAIADDLRKRGRSAIISIGIDERDEPEIYARLMNEISRRQLQDWFRITGRLPKAEVNRHLRESDCFVSPTRCESFGYPYIEAVAAGVPVVSSDIPIAREMLGGGALYFQDSSDAARRIESLAAAPDEATSLVNRARKHQSEFTIDWDEYGVRLAKVIADAGKPVR